MKKAILIIAAIGATVGATSLQARDHGEREKPAFSAIDTDGNGQITEAEMQAYRSARVAERFATADANNDGSLTVEEIVAAAREGAEDRAQRRAERMMSRLDANENGTLEADELAGRGDRGGKGFGRADANNDGMLSEAEYDAMKGRRGNRG